ncbi:hypothetical protein [Neotabrizicola sp. sgz301269]|uniref:hypothetical protein n=1 Tax=Neotabrizicola sp. sgz301269 TaxID=3276282 RepID=UPI0037704C4F
MKKVIAAICLAATLAGCVAMSPIVESRPVSLTSGQISQIKGSMAYDLKDPGSAQFRNIRAADVTLSDGTKERRVCGELNGKNSFGAYVGFEWFGGKMVGGKFVRDPFFGPCEA